MTLPLVSVIIPCFNQAQFLGEAIESALGQTYQRVEIVVVDDGSTDDTAAVAARYPGIRCVRQTNQGPARARNGGIRQSRGALAVFLDADDRLLPTALAAGCQELERLPECAFVSGHFRFIDIDGRPHPEWTPEPIGPDPYLQLLRLNYIGMVGTVMYRVAPLRCIGGFRRAAQPAEDYDSYLRIARVFPVYRHDRIVAEYRRYGTAISDNAARMLTGTLCVLRSQRPYIRGNPEYCAAYREGIDYWRATYLPSATEQVRHALRVPRDWLEALTTLAKLGWFTPVESLLIIRHLMQSAFRRP